MDKKYRRYAQEFAEVFFEENGSQEDFRGRNFTWTGYLDFVRRMSYIQCKGAFEGISDNDRRLIGELTRKFTEQILKEKRLI